MLAILAAFVLLISGALFVLFSLRDDAASLGLFTQGGTYCFQLIYLTDHLVDPQYGDNEQVREELPKVIDAADRRFLR